MSERKAIEQRIRSFIEDHAQWERTAADLLGESHPHLPSPCEIDGIRDLEEKMAAFREATAERSEESNAAYETMEKMRRELGRKHCTSPDHLIRHAISLGGELQHDPELEVITEISNDSTKAKVETVVPGSIYTYEYELTKVGGNWLISHMECYTTDTEKPEPADWSTAELAPQFCRFDDVGIDYTAAFQEGGVAYNNESRKRERIQVVSLGEIEVPSRLLLLADPAYSPQENLPLELRLPMPRVSLQAAKVGTENAFVRVWLGKQTEIASYVPARTITMDGDEATNQAKVGTRAGMIVVADAMAWTSLSPREGERFCYKVARDGRENGRAELFAIPLHPLLNGALILRGGGDYGCPAYWGLNSEEEPVALIIDLLICEESTEQALEIPYTDSLLNREEPIAQLSEFGYEVHLVQEGIDVEVHSRPGHRDLAIDLLDPKGKVLCSTDEHGLSQSGDESTHLLTVPDDVARGSRLRFRWSQNRHEFERPFTLE